MSELAELETVSPELSLLEEIANKEVPILTNKDEEPFIIELPVIKKFNLTSALDLNALAREIILQDISVRSEIEHVFENNQMKILGSRLYFNDEQVKHNTSQGAFENGYYEKLENIVNQYKSSTSEVEAIKKEKPVNQGKPPALKRGKVSVAEKNLIVDSYLKGMKIKEIAKLVQRKEELVDDIINEVRE